MPFLEIHIDSTLETSKTHNELVREIGNAYQTMYSKSVSYMQNQNLEFIRVDFETKSEFEAVFESSFNFYAFIFDNFLVKYPDFPKLFQKCQDHSHKQHKNYIVLRYKTDYITPLRRYYGFTSRVNLLFGSNVMNEEIEDGYLRFIRTKIDFLHLIQPVGIQADWEHLFKIRQVSLKHPLVKAFFEAFQEWNEKR